MLTPSINLWQCRYQAFSMGTAAMPIHNSPKQVMLLMVLKDGAIEAGTHTFGVSMQSSTLAGICPVICDFLKKKIETTLVILKLD